MPSPFPGMDPYIESVEIWRDFHHGLAAEIRRHLNHLLGPRYYAALEVQVLYESADPSPRRGVPDVAVLGTEAPARTTAIAVAIAPAPVESEIPLEDPLKLFTVELRATGSHVLVTSIEILAPANKQPGHDAFTLYLRKRRALLNSEANLLELDLLRAGERPPLARPVPSAPYYVTLSRAARRPIVEVWPLALRQPLPVVPVPLLPPDPDAPLDLGAVVATTYEDGVYERRLDYSQAPPPPRLGLEDEARMSELLRR